MHAVVLHSCSKWRNNTNHCGSHGTKHSSDLSISCFSCLSIKVPVFMSAPSTHSPENQVLLLIVYIKFKWNPSLPTRLSAPVYGSLTVLTLLHRPPPYRPTRCWDEWAVGGAHMLSQRGHVWWNDQEGSLALSREVLCVRGGDEPSPRPGSGWSRLRRVSEISPGVLSNKRLDRQVLPSLDQSIGCRTSGA